jgi:tetratricopeptide (TPR) repeat protein
VGGAGEEVGGAGDGSPMEEESASGSRMAESLARVEELLTAGDRSGAIAELEALSSELAASGDVGGALDVVRGALELDPDDLGNLQAQVEYAARLGDSRRVVQAYESLAAALARQGAVAKAQAVYRQILELDPENALAHAAQESPDGHVTDGQGVVGGPGPGGRGPTGGTRLVVPEAEVSRSRGFEDVLAQFKAKVDETIGSEDPESHYDLGLAYKEMGLLDEAIGEFRTALLGGLDRPAVYEELGQCFMLQERYDVAAKILGRAAESRDTDAESLLGVNYHLGRCLEELGESAAARAAFDRVLSVDRDFRDAAERAARL